MTEAFLIRSPSPSKMIKLRGDIQNFKRLNGEHIHESWICFKRWLLQCPNCGILDKLLIQCFCRCYAIEWTTGWRTILSKGEWWGSCSAFKGTWRYDKNQSRLAHYWISRVPSITGDDKMKNKSEKLSVWWMHS